MPVLLVVYEDVYCKISPTVVFLIVAVSSFVKTHKVHKDDAERVVEEYDRLLGH